MPDPVYWVHACPWHAWCMRDKTNFFLSCTSCFVICYFPVYTPIHTIDATIYIGTLLKIYYITAHTSWIILYFSALSHNNKSTSASMLDECVGWYVPADIVHLLQHFHLPVSQPNWFDSINLGDKSHNGLCTLSIMTHIFVNDDATVLFHDSCTLPLFLPRSPTKTSHCLVDCTFGLCWICCHSNQRISRTSSCVINVWMLVTGAYKHEHCFLWGFV